MKKKEQNLLSFTKERFTEKIQWEIMLSQEELVNENVNKKKKYHIDYGWSINKDEGIICSKIHGHKEIHSICSHKDIDGNIIHEKIKH